MPRLSTHRVLISGILSPLTAVLCYAVVYTTLTARSTHHEKDWLLRLSLSTLAMALPFLVTLALTRKEQRPLSTSARAGVLLAFLSLGLAWKPISDGIFRWQQVRNLAMHDVPAPLFETPDIQGTMQRLADHKGEVVLVNIWATWCGPCREEMPELDRLYRERKQEGFIVFGLSSEDVEVQQKFAQKVPVSYPLLTVRGEVPEFYRQIARYPSFFLIDRQGQLQRTPGPGEPFANLESAVKALLARPAQ